MGYTHPAMDQRERIAQYLAAGQSVPSIAVMIGRSPSTIYRELARNAQRASHYSPWRAEAAYQSRRQASRRPWRLEGDPDLRADVLGALRATWSPQQIAGRLAAEHPRAKPTVDKTVRVPRMFLVWAQGTGRTASLPLPKDMPMGHSRTAGEEA
jgi:IS30 family transposase